MNNFKPNFVMENKFLLSAVVICVSLLCVMFNIIRGSPTTSLSNRMSAPSTVFEKIVLGEAPAKVLHDDDKCMAIESNNPLAPVHFLVIPKKTIRTLSDVDDGDTMLLGHMMVVASKVAKLKKVDGFYRVVINNDDTTIPYLHIHVLGGRVMGWPPG